MSLRVFSVTSAIVIIVAWIPTAPAAVENMPPIQIAIAEDNIAEGHHPIGAAGTYDNAEATQSGYDLKADYWLSPFDVWQIPAAVIDFGHVDSLVRENCSSDGGGSPSGCNVPEDVFLAGSAYLDATAIESYQKVQGNLDTGLDTGLGAGSATGSATRIDYGLVGMMASAGASSRWQGTETPIPVSSMYFSVASDPTVLAVAGGVAPTMVYFANAGRMNADPSPNTFGADPSPITFGADPTAHTFGADPSPDTLGAEPSPDTFVFSPLLDSLEAGPLVGPVIPESPLPVMLLIGFGGIALIRRKKMLRTNEGAA